MERTILLGALVLFVLLALQVEASDINCEFKPSCAGDEAAVFYAENTTGGFHNAHIQLNNFTRTYAYALCCSSDENHTLNATCSNTTTTAFLRSAFTNNSHVQIEQYTNYAYDICLGATFGDLSCEYVNATCSAGFQPILSMASSEGNNGTNAHVSNYSDYRLNVCCTLTDSPPATPILDYPADGNTSVFERIVNLNWTVFEANGDPVTFNVSLNTSGSCAVEHQETGITDNNFTTNELCVDQNYNWSVQACDKDGCSAWAVPFNFTIASVLSLTFLQNTSTFAASIPGDTNDTDAGPGQPMRIENDGNVMVNVSLNATGPLFNNAGLGSSNFQFRTVVNESGSFDSGQPTYTNIEAALTSAYVNLNYQDVNDDGLIHYRVTVPADEPPGVRSTTILARATIS